MNLMFCRYCEKTESDMSTMYNYVNDKGKFVIDDIHKECKYDEKYTPKEDWKKRHDSVKKSEKKDKIKSKKINEFTGLHCEICGIYENDKNKLHESINKKGIKSIKNVHISCKEKEIETASKIAIENKIIKERKKIEKELDKIKNKTIIDRINETPEHKYCTKCEDKKHISEFYQNMDFTYYSTCKECHGKKTKEWTDKNKEKVKNYNKQYHKTYVLPEELKIKQKQKSKERYIKKKSENTK